MSNGIHDHDDEDCTCSVVVPEPLDAHAFAEITLGLFAALFGNCSSFFGLCGQEFRASSKYRRQEKMMAKYQAQEDEERAKLAATDLSILGITSEDDLR